MDAGPAAAQSMQIFLIFAGLVFAAAVCLFAVGAIGNSDR